MDARYLLIFGSGLVGGGLSFAAGLPMPFMLGGLFGTASFVIFYEAHRTRLPKLSNTFRQVFMAIIGAVIPENRSKFVPSKVINTDISP